MTVWSKAANFDAARASPMTWLIAIARNRAIDRLRATRQSRRMEPIEAASDVADGAASRRPRAGNFTRPRAAARLPGNAVSPANGRSTRRIFRWQYLRGAGGAHERPARHHEKLDQARHDQTQELPRAMSDTSDHNGLPNLPEDEFSPPNMRWACFPAPSAPRPSRALARDATFARMVAAWEERLAPWAAEIEETAPPPHVWEAIAAALPARFADAPACGKISHSGVALRLVSAVAAACLVGVIFFGGANRAKRWSLTIDGGGHHHFVATVDARRGTVSVMPAAFAGDANAGCRNCGSFPPTASRARSACCSADRSVTIAMPADLAALTVRNAVLAVSLEPPGGSPTGQPTGPVIAHRQAHKSVIAAAASTTHRPP